MVAEPMKHAMERSFETDFRKTDSVSNCRCNVFIWK